MNFIKVLTPDTNKCQPVNTEAGIHDEEDTSKYHQTTI